ncbi:MAG: BTAD domain-containing putative transcriptional regulator [Anaerolineales bacterium]
MLQVRLLGQFDVWCDGEPVHIPSRPTQALLAYLLLNAHVKTRREMLSGLLWPAADESNARTYLRQALWRLRKALGDDYFVADKITLGFNAAAEYELDTELLQRAFDNGSVDELARAVSAYWGPLLPDFYEEWVLSERERLQSVFDERIRTLIARLEADGRWQDVLEWGETWIARNHAPEPAFRALMRAYAALEDAAGIATAYARCVERLEKDLGLEPSAETRALYAELAGADWSPPPARSPYRGLYAFRDEDAPYYFGRETFVAGLVEAVEHAPLVAVVGPSGSGKSSVVFAGLIPRLRDAGDWQVVTFRPGADPFRALAVALAPLLPLDRTNGARAWADSLAGSQSAFSGAIGRVLESNSQRKLLLVVDQFEELYTLCTDRQTRRDFLDALLAAVASQQFSPHHTFRCALTLRADFMGRALAYRPMADALQNADRMLGPMTREELGRAIENPATTLGVSFEPGLVERMLDDVGHEPGNLPLLEFALAQLWERPERRTLTHAAYEAIGRVQGALAHHAEEVFIALDEGDRTRAQQVFLQLVQPGDQTEDTRRVATRSELGADKWQRAIALADARLVVTGRDPSGEEVAELAHEALIGGWGRLRSWMDADRSFRAWQERLRAALQQWQASARDAGALLRGAPLVEAQDWLAKRADDLAPDEQEFIDASAALQARRRAERERARRRVVVGLGTGLLVTALLALVAGFSWQRSQRDARAATEAYSLSVAANAQQFMNDLDPGAALVLALAAADIDDPPLLTRRTLLEAAHAPGARARYDVNAMTGGADQTVWSVAISPDGETALAGLDDGTVIYFVLATGDVIFLLPAHTGRVNGVTFSPDGALAVSASEDGSVLVWDLASGSVRTRFDEHRGGVRALAVNPTGTLVASGDTEAGLLLWDIDSSAVQQRFAGHNAELLAAAFTPDGQRLLASSGADTSSVADYDPDLILWDVASGGVVHEFALPQESVAVRTDAFSIAMGANGRRALTASSDSNLFEWDLASGELLRTFSGHADNATAVALGSDGRHILSGGLDGSVIQWDAASGEMLARHKVHALEVLQIAVAPNSRTALSGSGDGTLVVWDLIDAAEVRHIPLDAGAVTDVILAPDGEHFFSAASNIVPSMDGSDGTTIQEWDLVSGALVRKFEGHAGGVISIAISPDGQKLLSGSMDGTARVWDVASGAELLRFERHGNWVTEVAFTLDGRYALTGATGGDLFVGFEGGGLFMWDVETGDVVHEFETIDVWSMSVSPDGRRLTTGGNDSVNHVWDLESGEETLQFEAYGTGTTFTPDGASIIYGTFGNGLFQIDATTGEQIRHFNYGTALRARPTVSADGALLLSSDFGGPLYLWDLERAITLRRFGLFDRGSAMENVITPDNRYALVAFNNTITQWDLAIPSLDALRDWIAANRYVRDLTCEERELYQIEPLCDSA